MNYILQHISNSTALRWHKNTPTSCIFQWQLMPSASLSVK